MLQEESVNLHMNEHDAEKSTHRYECEDALETDDNVRKMYNTLNIDTTRTSIAGPI